MQDDDEQVTIRRAELDALWGVALAAERARRSMTTGGWVEGLEPIWDALRVLHVVEPESRPAGTGR